MTTLKTVTCVVAICGALLPCTAIAQDGSFDDHNLHGWAMYFGDHPLGSTRWGIHLEGQWRRHDGFSRWQQLLLRPGVNFQAREWLMLTGGYAYILSYPYGDPPASRRRSPEHRLWEQANFRYKSGRVSWSTRLRFENRFLGVVNAATGETERYRYENRFRAWQRATVPLDDRNYVSAYNELWFYVPPYQSASAFDQNRAYVALGRKFGSDWEFEAGYMHQLVKQRNGLVTEHNHTLMFTINSRSPFGASR